MIVAVMGVSGSGKTTIGAELARELGWPFLDADTLHTPARIDDMRRGIALTDETRAPWLAAVRDRMLDADRRGSHLIVACSALRAAYRRTLDSGLPVTWVYLKGAPGLIRTRIEVRGNHFMKADMLASQLAALEEPADAIVVDISRPVSAVVADILALLGKSAGRT